jgi:histidinol-phosphate aminotransferase
MSSPASLVRPTVSRAVVLAAGTGSRLASTRADNQHELPKPLRPVAGVPLVVRVLRTLQSEGIREAIIVTGHQGDRIKRTLLAEPSIAMSLTFVDNELYRLKNGVSLLAARPYIEPGTLLTMADHLYSPDVVRRLMAMSLPDDACALAVDHDPDRCFDIDDATKVVVERGRVAHIGKELEDYNALDTGVFRIGPALLDVLSGLFERDGDCSLSDGVRALAAAGRFFACSVHDARWIDVDTPAAMERAEAMIRVFGDGLGDEPAENVGRMDPEAVETFAPSWVRGVRPYREDHFELAARTGVQRMMSNESPYTPSPRVIDAIVSAALRGNEYPTSGLELRTKLAERDGFDAEWVTLGAGSTELIDVVIRTFVSPGEEVLISVPTFSMYEARTRTVGGIPVLVPLTASDEVDVGALISNVTERTKVLFVCTPNNPTGNAVEEAALRRVLRLGLPTVIDEAYWEFADEPRSMTSMLREFPNAIVLRTFSKAFGLAGMRLGYALTHPAVNRLLARVKLPWNISTLTLAAASAALDDMAEQTRRLDDLRLARAELVRQLGDIPGVSASPSEGNFVLIDASRLGLSPELVVEGMLRRGVLIRTLTVHHAQRSLLRITVGTREQNARCVAALRQVVTAPPDRDLTPTPVSAAVGPASVGRVAARTSVT